MTLCFKSKGKRRRNEIIHYGHLKSELNNGPRLFWKRTTKSCVPIRMHVFRKKETTKHRRPERESYGHTPLRINLWKSDMKIKHNLIICVLSAWQYMYHAR